MRKSWAYAERLRKLYVSYCSKQRFCLKWDLSRQLYRISRLPSVPSVQAACFCAFGQVEVSKKCLELYVESVSRYIKNKEDVKRALTYIVEEKKEVTESTSRKITAEQNKAIKCFVPDPHSQYQTFPSKIVIFKTEAKLSSLAKI